MGGEEEEVSISKSSITMKGSIHYLSRSSGEYQRLRGVYCVILGGILGGALDQEGPSLLIVIVKGGRISGRMTGCSTEPRD
jgi:hypothetical protein